MKTLLIATEPRTCRLLEDRLRHHGDDVVAAEDAAAGCAAVRSNDFPLIVLAGDACRGRTADLCRRIRSIPACRDSVILAVADNHGADSTQELLDAGADDVLPSLDDAELLETRLLVARHRTLSLARRQGSPTTAAPSLLSDTWFDLEDLPFGVFRTSLDGRFIAANPTLVRMLGYESEEELLQLDLARDVYQDPTLRERIGQQGLEHLDTYELDWKRKDGSPLVIRAVGCLVRDCRGEPLHIEGFIDDITTHKLSEVAVRESEARLRAVFENAAVGVVLSDLEGRFIQTNAAFAEMLGYSVDEITSKTVFDVSAGDDLDVEQQMFHELIAGDRSSLQLEKEYRRRDGCTVWGRVSGSLLVNAEGKPEFVMGVVEDITEQKQAARALADSESKLRSVVENMPDFVLIVDRQGKVVYLNHVRPDLAYESVLGINVVDFIPGAYRQDYERACERVFEAGEPQEHRLPDVFGATYEARMVPLREDGTIRYAMIIATDVTAREQATNRLHQSEERYRLITDGVADVIWTIDLPEPFDVAAAEGDPAEVAATLFPELRFSFASPSVQNVFGYTPEEMLNLHVTDVLAEGAQDRILRGLRGILRRMARGIPPPPDMTFEVDHVAKDGSIRACEIVPSILQDERGRILGGLGVTRDVTERRRAERAVRQSEAKLRSLFENLPDFVILVDGHAQIQYVNRGVPNVTPEQLVGGTGFDFLVPPHRDACREAFGRAFATNETQTVEALDVYGLWWACRVVPLAGIDVPEHAMIICTDITDQKRAGEAVEKEQQLLRQILDLHERDRQLIAYEIHDGFAQQLTGALFSLETYAQLQELNSAANWDLFREGIRLISKSIDETRRLISGLRPMILDERGIVAAVEYLACENDQSGEIQVDFDCNVQFDRLAAPLENTIFRIVQELLNNARRHSRSDRARVELVQDGEMVRVSVRDWGIGFRTDAVAENRFGLRGIRERARLFGGRIVIDTTPDQGTCVSVELPLVDPAPQPGEEYHENKDILSF